MSLPIFQRTIVDSSGNIQPGASVAVRNETTGDLVPIYADREGGTAKANPFLADAEGFATFYVEPGEYQVTATTPAGSITWSHVAIGDTALLELAQPTGSALVGFQQAGAGAVARTLQEKAQESVSVSDYAGPALTAIQSAIDYVYGLGGGTVELLPIEYLVTNQLILKDGVFLKGTPGKTTIKATANATYQLMRTSGTSADYLEDAGLYGIILDHNSSGGSSPVSVSAATLDFTRRLYVEKCVFQNASGYGLGMQARPTVEPFGKQEEIYISDCVFRNNGFYAGADPADGLDIKSGAKVYARNLLAYGNADKGLDIRASQSVIDGIITYGNGAVGIEVTCDSGLEAYNNNVSNVTASNNGGAGVSLAFQCTTSDLLSTNASNITSYNNGGAGVQIVNASAASLNNWTARLNNVIAYGNAGDGFMVNVGPNGTAGIFVGEFSFRNNTQNGALVSCGNIFFSNGQLVSNAQRGLNSTSNDFIHTLSNVAFSGNTLSATSGTLNTSFANCTGLPGSLIAGNGPRLQAVGTDENISVDVSSKGGGTVRFYRQNFADQIFEMTGATSTNGYLRAVSSSAARPSLQAQGSAANVDVEIQPKGTGHLRFGTLVASADAPITGYIEVKEAGGTVRRLAVIG